MSRYTGPKHRLCRREGVKLCDSPKCPLLRRNYPPGVHGPKGAPRLTAYGQQLREKQKAKRLYGVNERQFYNYFKKSTKIQGDTSAFLISMLEKRLDNVIYRLGYANSRYHARQLVSHGFFMVNGKNVNIPSYEVSPKDVIEIKPNKRQKKVFAEIEKKLQKHEAPAWVHFDAKNLSGKIISEPNVSDMKHVFNVQSIVEFYSR